jgi:hypothetical protein
MTMSNNVILRCLFCEREFTEDNDLEKHLKIDHDMITNVQSVVKYVVALQRRLESLEELVK